MHCFYFSRWRPPPSWIFKILNFYWQMQSRGSSCTIMPNFVKIGQTVFEISQFFIFQNGGRRHLGFQNSHIFGWQGLEGRDASSCQISLQWDNLLQKYRDFSIFQDGSRLHFGLYKLSNFIICGGLVRRCMILQNLVKICQSVEEIYRVVHVK